MKLRQDNCAEYCNYYWALINTVKTIHFPKRQNFLDYLSDYLLFKESLLHLVGYLFVIRTL